MQDTFVNMRLPATIELTLIKLSAPLLRQIEREPLQMMMYNRLLKSHAKFEIRWLLHLKLLLRYDKWQVLLQHVVCVLKHLQFLANSISLRTEGL